MSRLLSSGLALALLLCLAPRASAQPLPLPLLSPEVHAAERTATFRMLAPNAQRVTVTADFFGTKSFPMTKGDGGVWSVTVGPIEPDLYAYYYEVDGLNMADPANVTMHAGSSTLKSLVEIPGERAAFLAMRDVPHGAIHEHWYHSAELKVERRFLVYTPPGYVAGSDAYPVVYLLHGAGADEVSWAKIGRANFIMDNLLADKKAKPALIVMPFGQSSNDVYAGNMRRGGGMMGARGMGARGGGSFESAMLETDLKTNIMPLVEREYRTQKDAAHRAIMGLSMGGAQTLAIGLNNPQLFSYVAAWSWAGNNQSAAAVQANAAKANQDFKLIYLSCGVNDGLINTDRQLDASLTSAGVKHEWVASPDFAHEWTLWRRNLRDVLMKVFVEK